MSKPSKKKFEKQKKRQKQTYKELLSRRSKIMEKAKKERAEYKLERETREKIKPIVNTPKERTAEDIAKQIEANLQLLKQMEDEYENAAMEREGLNQALEAEGFKSLKEKMDFLQESAKEQASKQLEEMEEKIKKEVKKSRKKARKNAI